MRTLLTLLSLLVVSCSNLKTEKKIEPKAAGTAPIRWLIDSSFNDLSGPSSSISLIKESETFPLRIHSPVAFKPLNRENQAGWGVPKEAVIAALGFWAGYGEVLYAVNTENEVQVYYREIEELVDLPPFKLIKRIPIAK